MYSIVSTAILRGIESVPVLVEADVSDGMPMFTMVGFLASEVREASERVRTALRNSGYILPAKRITVNLSPADVRKSGSGFDLPVAAAVLAALGIVPINALDGLLVIGEIGLNGDVQPVEGILPMITDALRRGMKGCLLAAGNVQEACLTGGLQIYGINSLCELISFLNGEDAVRREIEQRTNQAYEQSAERECRERAADFSEVNGQALVRRACEVAVSGRHNLMMVGPPGSGKTMMAKRIPSILPPMSKEECLEVSKIYSAGGLLKTNHMLHLQRPFRSPHHTITPQGLAGGGKYPQPGEISFAHNGVLFLDEMTEFQKGTLEVLRQPLEDKEVNLVRMTGTYRYPADFLLVGSMNPCACGYYPDMQKCQCSQATLDRYLNRISQPLLDRIDICVEAPQLRYEEITATSQNESSAVIRERVMQVCEIQKQRFAGTNIRWNSQIPAAQLEEYCPLDTKLQKYMEDIYRRMSLTARTYHKILKVARTLADMEGSPDIKNVHLNEAVCYRSIDKMFWKRY